MVEKLKFAFLCGVAGLSIPAAGAAEVVADAPAQSVDAANDTGDIIVTAQRRSQLLRDVPIAITAISADNMERSGVIGVLDLPRLTPGLELPQFGAWTQPSIRGISSGGADVGDSSNVAMYIDGVYQNSQVAQLMDLPDVQQIEVLKGPQGTLYGQNAEGGAIIINTRAPSFTPEGKLSASYGNYNDIALRGYVSAGVTDTVAVSIAGSYQDRDGLRTNILTGDRDFGLRSSLVRGKILFQPSERASFTLTGYYANRKDSSPFGGQALNGNSAGYALFPDAPRPSNKEEIALSDDTYTKNKAWGVSLKSNLDVGIGDFTSVTGYSASDFFLIGDVDFSPVYLAISGGQNNVISARYFTQDLSFVTSGLGPLTVTIGGFFTEGHEEVEGQRFVQYTDAGATVAPDAPGPVAFDGSVFKRLEKRIFAVYAEAAYELTDKFTVTAGARYSHEKQKSFSDLYSGTTITPSPYNPGKFEKVTPRVTARYEIAPASNIYASWSKGFKSGLVNTDTLYSPPVKPEELTAYEVGYKGRPIDGVNINLAAFHYDFKNIQVHRFLAPATVYENAASARLNGVEFDANLQLTDEFSATLGGVYLDAKYKSFPEAGAFVPLPGGGNSNVSMDVSGKRLIRAPKFTGNLTLNYLKELDAGKIGAYVSAYYNDGSNLEASGRVRQKSYATVDGELSFSPASLEGVRFAAWVRNLTDKLFIQSTLLTNFADGVSYSAPRTFGVKAEYSF